MENRLSQLLEKYDVPVPRYTSYPTVPYWETEGFGVELWEKQVRLAFSRSQSVSLYIHLPYCEKICTYCGCNKRITKNHEVETPYIQSVLQEWSLYLQVLGAKPIVEEIHLGGGTPTFFSAENLKALVSGILDNSQAAHCPEYSFEAHPNSTTVAHLQTLYDLGFRRLSLGIQDFDPQVQRVINRLQSFEATRAVFEAARKIGYESINADLIYGLPKQTLHSVLDTIEKVKALRPDRIAFYSYAHVPWKSPTQRGYSDEDLPKAAEKRALYEAGRSVLLENGYYELGLDHFALPGEALHQAAMAGTMHRNFMGYTPKKTSLLIGLGASSISDTLTAFAQNHKEIEDYQAAVAAGKLPVVKGHLLTDEDLKVRDEVLALMCQGRVKLEDKRMKTVLPRLEPLLADGLVELQDSKLIVSPIGRAFLRNIALQFDERYHARRKDAGIFSQAI